MLMCYAGVKLKDPHVWKEEKAQLLKEGGDLRHGLQGLAHCVDSGGGGVSLSP